MSLPPDLRHLFWDCHPWSPPFAPDLDQTTFDAAWAEGRAMSVEQAIRVASSEDTR